MASKFKVGDLVIKNNGTKPCEVVEVSYSYITCRYVHNNKAFTAYDHELKLYEPECDGGSSLYSFVNTDGTTGYGTHVGTDSQNRYLIEIKGSGEIRALHPLFLEEVLPYTFSVRVGSRDIHYIGTPDELAVNDLIVDDKGNFFRVKAVDTKNKTARKRFEGHKVPIIPLTKE